MEKKDKSLTVNLILIIIWCWNDKFITQNWNICYNLQSMFQNLTVNLKALCKSCAKNRVWFIWVYLYGSRCVQQLPKCKRPIRLVCTPFCCKLHSSSNPTNNNLTHKIREREKIGHHIQNLSRIQFIIPRMFAWTFFLTMADTILTKNINLSSWITLNTYFYIAWLWLLFKPDIRCTIQIKSLQSTVQM